MVPATRSDGRARAASQPTQHLAARGDRGVSQVLLSRAPLSRASSGAPCRSRPGGSPLLRGYVGATARSVVAGTSRSPCRGSPSVQSRGSHHRASRTARAGQRRAAVARVAAKWSPRESCGGEKPPPGCAGMRAATSLRRREGAKQCVAAGPKASSLAAHRGQSNSRRPRDTARRAGGGSRMAAGSASDWS
eukprot:1760204-Prymnesium_polylepis.2